MFEHKNPFAVLVVIAALLVIAPLILMASMSDSKAVTTAKSYWGPAAMVAKFRKFGDANWSTQVGFASPGCRDPFQVEGAGFDTWDDAFAKVSGGPIQPSSGIVNIDIEAPAVQDPTSSAYIPGIVDKVQILIDGQPSGPVIRAGDTPTWHAKMAWDSSTVADGYHTICAALYHPDGSFSLFPATMVQIRQATVDKLAPRKVALLR